MTESTNRCAGGGGTISGEVSIEELEAGKGGGRFGRGLLRTSFSKAFSGNDGGPPTGSTGDVRGLASGEKSYSSRTFQVAEALTTIMLPADGIPGDARAGSIVIVVVVRDGRRRSASNKISRSFI